MDSKQKNEGLKFSKGAQEAMPARSTTVVFTPRSARWYEIETPMTPLLLMSSHVYAARVLLSLSLTCTYITEQKTRACHMPPVILQVKFIQDLSGSQKKQEMTSSN